ncbi:PREDICTED: sialic acid-binding Ig-like lectin 5, partial [Myotis davidii]|uniref:sialic acid-binding Ig-like lectin 5 n=1 Tax=Myotis davidii TaxID=225400 RepID=UPI000767588C
MRISECSRNIGAAVDSLDPQTLRSSVLTFTPRPRDHGTSLTCQVKLQGSWVATQRTIRLNVSYASQNLTIDVSLRNVTALKILQTTSFPILEGEALRLRCEADSNPPAELSWFQRFNLTFFMWFSPIRHSRPFSSLLNAPPQLLGPSCSWEDQGLHCSCSSRAQPTPSLCWRLGAGLLEGNHGNASHRVSSPSAGPWTNSSLSLKEGLSKGLSLSCEARNVHGAQSASVLLPPGQGLLGAEATETGVGPTPELGTSLPDTGTQIRSALSEAAMVHLLLLPLLLGGEWLGRGAGQVGKGQGQHRSLNPPPPGSRQQQQGGYELQVQESVTVQEGLCIHVPCSFSFPWSSWSSSSNLYTYWYRDGDNINSAAPVASSNWNKTVKRGTEGRFLFADPTTNN